MRYYLAVDQGGSKTEALLFDQSGRILSRADDRKVRLPGESLYEKQGAWIQSAAQAALQQAGLSPMDLTEICCALNGADWPVDYVRLRTLVSGCLAVSEQQVWVVNDCVGAMRGGTESGNRAVLCVGTGMNCAIASADGREYIYGYFVTAEDQGGGALGTHAWNAVLEAHSGIGEKTALTGLVLRHYEQTDLVSLFTKFTTGQIFIKKSDLCPLLMQAAKGGDSVSLSILGRASHRMIRYVEEGIKRLDMEEEMVTLVLTGGVLKGDGGIFYEMLCDHAKRSGFHITCQRAQYEPVAGTALLLIDRLDIEERAQTQKYFCAQAERWELSLRGAGISQGLQYCK